MLDTKDSKGVALEMFYARDNLDVLPLQSMFMHLLWNTNCVGKWHPLGPGHVRQEWGFSFKQQKTWLEEMSSREWIQEASVRLVRHLRIVTDASQLEEPLVVPRRTYFVLNKDAGAVKIGTSDFPQERLAQLQTGSPSELELILTIDSDVEEELHRRFSDHRIRGEWFRFDGAVKEFYLQQT